MMDSAAKCYPNSVESRQKYINTSNNEISRLECPKQQNTYTLNLETQRTFERSDDIDCFTSLGILIISYGIKVAADATNFLRPVH